METKKKAQELLDKLERDACNCEAIVGWSCGVHDTVKELRKVLSDAFAEGRLTGLEEAAEIEYYDKECGGVMPLPKNAKDVIFSLASPPPALNHVVQSTKKDLEHPPSEADNRSERTGSS